MKLPDMNIFKNEPIIDVHVHTWFEHPEYKMITDGNGINFSLEGLRKECQANNVSHFCSFYNKLDDKTPIGAAEAVDMAKQLPGLIGVGVINPADKDAMKRTDKAITEGAIKALKVYQGYYPYACTDKVWHPYYELAAKHDIPVFVHTGDTMGDALLKYSRPLFVDEIAVRFPDTKFVITQLGNPWFVDAAEVTYKNDNVYLECGGLFSGMSFSKLYHDRLQFVIDFIDDHRKIMYGSDWPTVKMADYLTFIKSVFPKRIHSKLFSGNARKLLKL